MNARYLLIAAAATTMVACGPKVEEEERWGVYQEPFEPIDLPADSGAREMKVQWNKRTGSKSDTGYAVFQPAIFSGSVYASSRNGEVLRYSIEKGALEWKTDLDLDINAGVGVGEGVVAVSHDNGVVTALDSGSGEVNWQTPLRRQVSAVPVVGKGRVIIRTSDGLVIGLDAVTGEVRWQVTKEIPGLTVHGDSAPVITGDAVLVGLSNGRLIANNVVNGRDYWEAEIDFSGGRDEIERLNDSDTPPVIVGSTIYSATYQGSVVALRLQDASSIWTTDLSTRRPMAIVDNQLIVIGELGEVVALDAISGEILWTQDAFRGHGVSAPVIAGNRIIIGDAEGNIHSLESNGGALVQTLDAVSGAVIGLVAEDNVVVVLSSGGEVSTINIQ